MSAGVPGESGPAGVPAGGAGGSAAQPGAPDPAPPPTWTRRAGKLLGLYLVWSAVVGVLAPVGLTVGLHRAPSRHAAQVGARAEDVELVTEDGVTLRGVYVAPEPGRPVVLAHHGINNNRDDILPWLQVLARRGYGGLAVDWRGHGASGGTWIGYGVYEAPDIRAMDAFLDARPELAGRPRAVLAVSMGAAIAALHAGEYGPEYRCMVLDSPFGNLARMVDSRLETFGPLGWLPAQLMKPVARLWVGTWPGDVAPERGVAAFAPRPLLVLQGEEDEIIPVAEGRSLLAAYPGPKAGWFTPGDRHTQARVGRARAWFERVAGFLAEHLEGAPAAEAVLRGLPPGSKERSPSGS